jgi:hypothetical protein
VGIVLTRLLTFLGIAFIASCSRYASHSGGEATTARNPRMWSADYSNNSQNLTVLMGDQVQITLGWTGPGWRYEEPTISSPAVQLENIALQAPSSPGGPVYIYTLRTSAVGDARFQIHFANSIFARDELYALNIRVQSGGNNSTETSRQNQLSSIGAFDGTEPILGSWVLNMAKSTFEPGHAPVSETRTFKPAPEGIKAATEITNDRWAASGVSSIYEKPGSVATTSPQLDVVTRLGRRKYGIDQLESGTKVGHQTAVISEDGTELTIKDAQTFIAHFFERDVRVFDRQSVAN